MNTNKRMVLYGDHDTGVMATACALHFSDRMRPMIASHIAFEVWKNEALPSSDPPYIRIVYNGQAVTDKLTHCTEEMCPFTQFVASVEWNFKRYGAKNFEAACAM